MLDFLAIDDRVYATARIELDVQPWEILIARKRLTFVYYSHPIFPYQDVEEVSSD